MEQFEKVEKLREKANITYEEAKAVLEECGWDLLDAVVKLEADGKMGAPAKGGEPENAEAAGSAYFSTTGSQEEEIPKSPQQLVESYQHYQQSKQEKGKGIFQSLWDGVKYIVKKGCDNKFIARRHGEVLLDIPVLLLVILMIGFFWILLILMGVSLFFGFSYSFAGPELGRDDINDMMGKATTVAENLKAEAREQHHRK